MGRAYQRRGLNRAFTVFMQLVRRVNFASDVTSINPIFGPTKNSLSDNPHTGKPVQHASFFPLFNKPVRVSFL